jgi:hypothetical protein
VTLVSFQRAFCDLIASPDLCVRLRRDPDAVLSTYDLSDRERRRLVAVARQRGMSVNCTLYRVNRVTPIYTLLPRTCALLGDRLPDLLHAFWRQSETDLQYGPELERFARFVRDRLQAGQIEDPLLREVLDFELAWNALRYVPRRRILEEREGATPAGSDGRAALSPLMRVVRFEHDPVEVFRMLGDGGDRGREHELEQREHFLLLDATTPRIELRPLEPHVGRELHEIAGGL